MTLQELKALCERAATQEHFHDRKTFYLASLTALPELIRRLEAIEKIVESDSVHCVGKKYKCSSCRIVEILEEKL